MRGWGQLSYQAPPPSPSFSVLSYSSTLHLTHMYQHNVHSQGVANNEIVTLNSYQLQEASWKRERERERVIAQNLNWGVQLATT